ncbi:GLPGLI family protein [Sediminibacterium soli]|uniref:GLPGLI family protein n=1 Tax=Sediminibacterium soli TaxID=2698829 RepID=UPI001379ACE7|nr:GLPGLI family protein [Sediminibacterium soli]NCI45951.1 GLPGLI family protein [Sediminibacterium soli]
MKKILALIPGAFFCVTVSAQTDQALATARYTLTHVSDTTQPEKPLVQKFILYLGSSMSRYANDMQNGPGGNIVSLGALRNVTTTGVGNIQAVSVPAGDMKNWQLANSYIKLSAENRLSYLAMAGMKLFSVEEPAPAIDWAIAPDTRQIMGMPCQKANGRFKGRDYEAWFAAQLPYSNGPWKLGGLPGLILEAYDTKKEVVFTLTEFKAVKDTAIEIAIPATAIKTTPKEYKQYREALMQQVAAGGVTDVAAGTLRFSGTVSGGITSAGQATRPRQFNNPIEKEEKN